MKPNSKPKKLLWGICGVGMGHAHRQLPLIQYFSVNHQVVIITCGDSYHMYKQELKGNAKVTVVYAQPPYLPDGASGIGFKEAINLDRNQNIDFFKTSAEAFTTLNNVISRPDLVIGDYKPYCAQYAYAHNAPVITFDQQSKYLSGDFPDSIRGCSYSGEVMRLQMFYPKVEERIAASFFKFKSKPNAPEVTIVPPIIRQSIQAIKPQRKNDGSLLVYLSEYPDLLNAVQLLEALSRQHDTTIKLFAKGAKKYKHKCRNLKLREPNNQAFVNALKTCSGIICTAGHSLLSEAMYLGIPVYALPRKQYEALMCARVIAGNGFGTTSTMLNQSSIAKFINNLHTYRQSIHQNSNNILLRTDGTSEVIDIINRHLGPWNS